MEEGIRIRVGIEMAGLERMASMRQAGFRLCTWTSIRESRLKVGMEPVYVRCAPLLVRITVRPSVT
jgi:hypothetical protein